jgi:hypothetical protein
LCETKFRFSLGGLVLLDFEFEHFEVYFFNLIADSFYDSLLHFFHLLVNFVDVRFEFLCFLLRLLGRLGRSFEIMKVSLLWHF